MVSSTFIMSLPSPRLMALSAARSRVSILSLCRQLPPIALFTRLSPNPVGSGLAQPPAIISGSWSAVSFSMIAPLSALASAFATLGATPLFLLVLVYAFLYFFTPVTPVVTLRFFCQRISAGISSFPLGFVEHSPCSREFFG